MMFGVFNVRVPPEGWKPEGYVAPAKPKKLVTTAHVTADQAIKTPQFWLLWGVLCMNVTAGIGILAQASPLIQESFPGRVTPAAAAGFVGLLSLFNLVGRFFWSSLSDKIGRKNVFLTMFATQAALYFYLPQVTSVLTFTMIACYLLACLGGGFAVMPALAADSFGPTYIGKVYGFVLTAWGAAGVAGGLAFAKFDKQQSLHIAAGLLIAGFVVTLMFQRPKHVSHYKAAQPEAAAEYSLTA